MNRQDIEEIFAQSHGAAYGLNLTGADLSL